MGNIKKMEAQCLLDALKKNSVWEPEVQKATLLKVKEKLEEAIKHFKKDDCNQGLGLTYNLMGRIHHSYKSIMHEVDLAREYYQKAIIEFKNCEHYRGSYVTLKDLYDLEMKNKLETQAAHEEGSSFFNAPKSFIFTGIAKKIDKS